VNFTPVCGKTYYLSVGSFSAAVFGSGQITITPSGTCAPACPADFTHDGVVGPQDITVLLGAWGTPAADLTGDGITGPQDITVLLSSWGACP